MTEDEFRRVSDVVASRTEQKLDDFLKQYEKDQELSKEWRKTFSDRLAPLEELNDKLKTPIQVFIWICTAAMGALGISLWKWVEKHWNG
jgi:hypothetical protein